MTTRISQRYMQTTTDMNEDENDSTTTCCESCHPQEQEDFIRILTWEPVQSELQGYADSFSNNSNNNNKKKVRIHALSSLQELHKETVLSKKTTLYDGYILPPMIMGNLQQELAGMDADGFTNVTDYLPYYQTLLQQKQQQQQQTSNNDDGSSSSSSSSTMIQMIPLLSGNQMLLFYRKDYFQQHNLNVPQTWEEMTQIATDISQNNDNNNNNNNLSGMCLGRLNVNGCRIRKSTTNNNNDHTTPCHSLSMAYLGMILASKTQQNNKGSSLSQGGWLVNANTFEPLWNSNNNNNSILWDTLLLMEQQIQQSKTDELLEDSSINLELLQQGQCAMTLSVDHPIELIDQEYIGVVSLPGSDITDLVMTKNDGGGNNNNNGGSINRVAFGSPTDLVVGGISGYSSKINTVQEFFQWIQSNPQQQSQRQPLTYSELQSYNQQEYVNVLQEVTSNPNAAVPLMVPNAFLFLSDMDEKVYQYLQQNEYTTTKRQQLILSLEQSWQVRTEQYDQYHDIPLSVLYKESLSLNSYNSENNNVIDPTQHHDDMYIEPGVLVTGWIVGAFAVFLALGFAFWTKRHQHERIVRASQPIFLYSICAGAFFMALAIYPFGLEDEVLGKSLSHKVMDASCISGTWLYAFGHVLLVSALYSKIWRINRIFRFAHKIRKIQIGIKDVLVPFLCLFGVNLIILIPWLVTDAYHWQRVPMEEDNMVTTGQCYSDNNRVFLGFLIGFNLIVSIYSLIQAFESRKISTEFEESLWISAALLCIVQVWLVCLPILHFLGKNPTWVFLVKVCVVFLTSVSALLCVFVPKMGYLRKARTAETSTDIQEDSAPIYETDDSSELEEIVPSSKPFQSMFPLLKFGSQPMMSPNDVRNSNVTTTVRSGVGMMGIRIVRSIGAHSQEMERLRDSLVEAEERRRISQDKLESLQEKFEQYIVANHPEGAHADMSMTEARRPSVREILKRNSYKRPFPSSSTHQRHIWTNDPSIRSLGEGSFSSNTMS